MSLIERAIARGGPASTRAIRKARREGDAHQHQDSQRQDSQQKAHSGPALQDATGHDDILDTGVVNNLEEKHAQRPALHREKRLSPAHIALSNDAPKEEERPRSRMRQPVRSEPEESVFLEKEKIGQVDIDEDEEENFRSPASNSQGFDLDFAWLAEQGFFTPNHREKRLALELRAIKRRLLRRLHFYRLDSEKRRRKTGRDRQRNTVLFTSTRPAEGKTFNAINLALSLAIEDNINVLLIDADVPRPKIFHHLGLKAGLGLTDRIVDPSLPVSEMIRRERTYPLSVLSQGQANVPAIDVFSRDEMFGFIDEVSLRYPDRVIIFDAPPVLATPEAVVLAKHVDEVVFVVEANQTPEPAVATALDEILDHNARVSLILNRCLAPEAASHYGSYEEYYNKPGTTKSSGNRRSKRR